MRVVKTVTTPDQLGDARVWAGEPKGGKYAGTPRASLVVHAQDLAASPELLAIVGEMKVSLHFDQDIARIIARDVPELRERFAAQGIKPAAKNAKRVA